MKKNVVVFMAVYMVVAQGIILAVAALDEATTPQALTVFISGTISLGISLIFMKILKRTIHKKRPEENQEFFVPLDRYAFPSGHATGLSVMTTYIFEKNMALGLVSLCLGVLILGARIVSHVHDYIDIIGGIVLGALIAVYLSPTVEHLVSLYLLTHMSL